MTPDGALIQRCPNDKSSGGARLPASPAPAGISIESWQPSLRASSAVSGAWTCRGLSDSGLQSGRVVEQAGGEARRPRGAGAGDRHQQEAVRRSRQGDDAAAGQAFGGQQHHIQHQPGRGGGNIVPGARPVRSSRTGRLPATRPVVRPCSGVQVQRLRRPDPRRHATASAAVPASTVVSSASASVSLSGSSSRAISSTPISAPSGPPGHGRAGRRAVRRGATISLMPVHRSPSNARTTHICRNIHT